MNTLLAARDVETAGTPGPRAATPAPRILVVDDDPFIRQMSVRTLLDSGYQVDTAEDGAAGWEALQLRRYDLLLTDHNMPKLTGAELVQKMWSARMTLPVILVSGALPTEELARHPWLKFVALLSKPFSLDELFATVKAALSAPGAGERAGVPRAIASPGWTPIRSAPMLGPR